MTRPSLAGIEQRTAAATEGCGMHEGNRALIADARTDLDALTAVCAWCPARATGAARHNDGRLYPSCGQPDHGLGWVTYLLPPDEPIFCAHLDLTDPEGDPT